MMFILKKVVTPFLLPPGLLVLLLLGWGVWRLRCRSRAGALGAFGLALMIWVLSVAPTADLLMSGLEADFSVPKELHADAIIMLGGAAYRNVPDLSGKGAPGEGTMERLVTAARLYRRMGVPIIVSGGRGFAQGASIAELAQRFLVDLGVPPAHILLEGHSRDTYENALLTKIVCDRYGFQNPLLVTTGFHLKRAVLSFEAVGMKVTPFPCGLTTYPGKTYHWYHWLPGAGSLAATSAALHEWFGLLYYRIRY